LRLLICGLLVLQVASAQVCRLSIAGLNRNRRVVGEISAECPDPLHTTPFGNWGATSNFGPKRNGHQFQGWCHDMRLCDNAGICRNVCRDGWYEWNTCTTDPLFRAPNCTLYNSAECTEQVSPLDVNVLGTQTVDLPAACPASSGNGAGFDRGGCAEVLFHERTDNFMSLYELDPITGDELIQSLYFPALRVDLRCSAWGCPAAGSEWADPVAWDSPATPAKVFAQMAMIVNSAAFVDPSNVCRITPVSLRAVSSATFAGPALARDSIATIFAGGMGVETESAGGEPLPTTLAGLQVRITDTGGFSRNAPLVFVSPNQINFIVPASLREGVATVSVLAGNTVRATGEVPLVSVQPGIFMAPSLGGLAAALGVRGDASQVSFACEGPACVPAPIAVAPGDTAFALVLFGTGIRNRTALENVTVTVGGVSAPVLYAGVQPTFAGLDQINVLVPPAMTARGQVPLIVVVDGKPANPVTVVLR